MLTLLPMASHDQESHVACHFNCYDLRNAMVPLLMLLAFVEDFFVQFLHWFQVNTLIGLMELSNRERFMLSAWNEANEVKHGGQDYKIGIISLAYLLGIGGIQIHILYYIDALYIQLVYIYGIISGTV